MSLATASSINAHLYLTKIQVAADLAIQESNQPLLKLIHERSLETIERFKEHESAKEFVNSLKELIVEVEAAMKGVTHV